MALSFKPTKKERDLDTDEHSLTQIWGDKSEARNAKSETNSKSKIQMLETGFLPEQE